jgi:hypothetical protein
MIRMSVGNDGIDAQQLTVAHFNARAAPTQDVDAVSDTNDGRVGETRFQHLLKKCLGFGVQRCRCLV